MSEVKFIQIACNAEQIIALDDKGRLWLCYDYKWVLVESPQEPSAN